MAEKNAKLALKHHELKLQKEFEMTEGAIAELQQILNLTNVPKRIEAFDISNIMGTSATGSMVVFENGKPKNSNYRHYKIQSVKKPDDVAMMREVIKRRYNMLLQKNLELPDLILVDGGKGQLNAGISILEELGLNIPIIGLAKKYEEIYLPSKKNPIVLPKSSSVLKLFQRVRDEAHRFAVKLQKKQRKKRITGSILDDIEGIGPVTRNKLLKHFGSVDNIRKSTLEEISQIIGEILAKKVLDELIE